MMKTNMADRRREKLHLLLEFWRCWTFKYGAQDLHGFKKVARCILGYGSIREWRIEAFFRCNRLLKASTQCQKLENVYLMRINQLKTDFKCGFSEKL